MADPYHMSGRGRAWLPRAPARIFGKPVAARAPTRMRLSPKGQYFWPLLLTVFLTDCATKAVAERSLAPAHVPHEVLGDVVRFTLAYNTGAAMSLSLGEHSRVLLVVVSTLALAGLGMWYRRLHPEAISTGMALALIAAGAAGNLWDRLRTHRGVVDFIDVGLGEWRFYIFNVSDVAITIGAIWLAVLLSRPQPLDG